jgi:hypothetical protein
MKNLLILATMLLTFGTVNAQDASSYKKAVINDPDGYTNVRDGKSVNYNVIAKIYENEVFFAYPSTASNWYPVITKNGIKGYVHNSRISFLSNNNSNQNITSEEMSLIINLLGGSANSSKLICKRNSCKKEFCCGWEHSSTGGCREACITGVKCRGDYCSQYCCEKD